MYACCVRRGAWCVHTQASLTQTGPSCEALLRLPGRNIGLLPHNRCQASLDTARRCARTRKQGWVRVPVGAAPGVTGGRKPRTWVGTRRMAGWHLAASSRVRCTDQVNSSKIADTEVEVDGKMMGDCLILIHRLKAGEAATVQQDDASRR